MEHAFHIYAPEGVSVCSTKLPKEISDPDLEAAFRLYREYDAEALAVAPELGLCNDPAALDRKCKALSTLAGGKTVLTGGQAVCKALNAVGGHCVAMITPYPDAINDHIRDYLELSGFRVAACIGMDMAEFDKNHLPYEAADRDFLYKNARAADIGEADVLFLCGECLDTMEMLAYLERDLRIPVISSQQALLWAALRACRVNAKKPDLGKLFSI